MRYCFHGLLALGGHAAVDLGAYCLWHSAPLRLCRVLRPIHDEGSRIFGPEMGQRRGVNLRPTTTNRVCSFVRRGRGYSVGDVFLVSPPNFLGNESAQ